MCSWPHKHKSVKDSIEFWFKWECENNSLLLIEEFVSDSSGFVQVFSLYVCQGESHNMLQDVSQAVSVGAVEEHLLFIIRHSGRDTRLALYVPHGFPSHVQYVSTGKTKGKMSENVPTVQHFNRCFDSCEDPHCSVFFVMLFYRFGSKGDYFHFRSMILAFSLSIFLEEYFFHLEFCLRFAYDL